MKSIHKMAIPAVALVVAVAADAGTAVQRYDSPRINGLWVDGCMVNFGTTDCSQSGRATAAQAFCSLQGGGQLVTWETENPGGDHETMRWTKVIVGGQPVERFEYCNGCSDHFTRIDCRFNF